MINNSDVIHSDISVVIISSDALKSFSTEDLLKRLMARVKSTLVCMKKMIHKRMAFPLVVSLTFITISWKFQKRIKPAKSSEV